MPRSKTRKAGWTKLPPYQGTPHRGCLNCGATPKIAPMEMMIAAGFGDAQVTRDGVIVYKEQPEVCLKRPPQVRRFEKLAAADPDHDWRIILNLPLRMAEYQRHAPKQWILVKSGMGFA